ncbi:hypothetical protein [Variovorax fucosicus]|uniref:hypothetical protein n=2 Tax=Variovorax fucosicus TaxID=3053517 RepID=UPI0025769191|nr:hypothetical protein [Variovorax sp. J22R193]
MMNRAPLMMMRSAFVAWMAALVLSPLAAQAADDHARPAPAGSQSKPLQSVKRGTDAAGRSINRADHAARRGIATGSERASAGPRRVGEAFGRKLAPGSSGRAAPPPVGPQGNPP